MCAVQVIMENDIEQETKDLFDYIFSDEWIDIVETGTKEEFEGELALAIDSLTNKVMGIPGPVFVETMSYEMGEWIKDTSLLWIKNRGAGQTTTEAEINNIKLED